MRVALSVALLVGLTLSVHAQPARPVAVSVAEVTPFLSTNCFSCHNQERKTAGIMLDMLDVQDVSRDAAVWEKILRQLRARTMPMPFAPTRPNRAAYANAITLIETVLDRSSAQSLPRASGERASDAEFATRLARFLWNAEPDAVLLDAARQRQLQDRGRVEQQVRRMLRDPKASGLVSGLFEQWLPIEPTTGPRRDAFIQETRLFLSHQIREDRPAMEMWTADYTFANEQLAAHYQIPNVSGAEFRRVNPPGDTRRGLLGHGSFLSRTSAPARTSPTARGALLLEVFFGVSHATPPPNLPAITFDGPARKVIDTAYGNQRCRACHYITQLGSGLENFDAVGGWRTSELGQPIDASGAFPDRTPFDGPASFRAGLLDYRDSFLTTLTEKLYSYAVGRGPEGRQVLFHEMPMIRAVLRDAAKTDFRWSSLILGIVNTPQFHMRATAPRAPSSSPAKTNFAGMWVRVGDSTSAPIGITQTADAIEVPRGARRWTFHLNKWGPRYAGPGGEKPVQARWDGDKLIVTAAPTRRYGTVAEVWSLSADGSELVAESVAMSEVTTEFDFKESSISPVYARTRTVYRRVRPGLR